MRGDRLVRADRALEGLAQRREGRLHGPPSRRDCVVEPVEVAEPDRPDVHLDEHFRSDHRGRERVLAIEHDLRRSHEQLDLFALEDI